MNEARRGGEVQSFALLPAVALVLGGYWTTSAVPGVAMFANDSQNGIHCCWRAAIIYELTNNIIMNNSVARC
jgi:hypothetical protein